MSVTSRAAAFQRDEEVVLRLLDLFQRMQQHWESTCAAHGLSPAEGQALHRLDTPAPMRAMAQALHCDASYVTQLTDRLEGAGLVERVADPTDRRVRQLRLTAKGARTRTDLIAASHADSPALAPLADAQRDELLALLRQLSDDSPTNPTCQR
jgi:DNA-binding MarR family transcriptional regulator